VPPLDQARKHAEELAALAEIGWRISQSVTLNVLELLEVVYSQVARLMDVSNFYIALYDEEDDTVSFPLAVENGASQVVGVAEWSDRRSGNGLTEYVIRTREPVLVAGEFDKWLAQHGVYSIGRTARSWLGAPMISRGRVLGVVAVQSHTSERAYGCAATR
jgi:signal transduction protein with GAF and PtsI domain